MAELFNFAEHQRRPKQAGLNPPPPADDELDIGFLESLLAKPRLDGNDMILLCRKLGADPCEDVTPAEWVNTALVQLDALAMHANTLSPDQRAEQQIPPPAQMGIFALLLENLLLKVVEMETPVS